MSFRWATRVTTLPIASAVKVSVLLKVPVCALFRSDAQSVPSAE